MKRSRACEDLLALETQKRNKLNDDLLSLSDHAFAMGSLLTRTASAEEELAVLLHANALAGYDRITAGLNLQDLTSSLSFDDDLLDQLNAPRDSRSASLLEKETRAAKDAIQFKSFLKRDDAMLMMMNNSPDSLDSLDALLRQNSFLHAASSHAAASQRSSIFDMSSFITVLEPHSV